MSLTEFQHLARRNERERERHEEREGQRERDDTNDRQVVTPALIVPHSRPKNI